MELPSQGRHGFDSAFARQIDAGFPWLRFDPELEPGFREAHRMRTLPYVRVALWLGLILVGLFLAEVARRGLPEPHGLAVFLPAGVFAVILGLALAASHVRRLSPWFDWLVAAAAAATTIGTVGWVLSLPEPFAQLAFAVVPVGIAFAYFALGLAVRTSAALALVATLIYAGGALLLGVAPGVAATNAIVLSLASLTCGLGAYMLEHTLRTAYLEGQLLAEMVDRDGLTGLFNRRAFDRYFDHVWSVARRQRAPLSLLLVDIDHFKPYNDHHGHQAGDDCLRRVAATVAGSARRPLDFAARYGGEEFVVVLYGIDHGAATRVATMLVDRVAKLRIPHAGSDVARVVTISVGLTTVTPADTDRSPHGIIQLADRCLYQAKREGRNRVVGEEAEGAFIQTGVFEIL
jgi:diguanylate cyclase (GGDEF)-like protein